MHHLRLIAACCVLFHAAIPALAQQTRMLTPDKYSDYGLVYALPRTAIEVELTARHTLRQAGPFRMFAPKYLGTGDVIMEDSESWEITDVRMRPYGVANDSSIYRMQLKAGQSLSICVADDGMLLAINTEGEAAGEWEPLQNPHPMLMPPATEYLQYAGEDFGSARSDARRAAILAATLAEVRQARLELTRGTADNMPSDGHQLEIMLNSLAHQEELLLNAFRGREMSETRSARFSLVPDSEGRYVLARINPFNGFINRDDLSGAPVYVDIKAVTGPEVPVDADGKELQMPRDGVMYCLPGTAEVTVLWQGRELFSTTMEMSQMGTTFALSPSLFTNKKAPACATFNPVTGGLRYIGEIKQQP